MGQEELARAASGAADAGRLEVLVEELPLGEAHPPLAGLVLAKGVHGLDETVAGLLPELGQVLTDLVCCWATTTPNA
mgnify:CR=1 FL=1